MDKLQPKTLILASPRGFCAGVERAIKIVERALEKFGAPIYVRHEIVHNKRVVDDLAAKGAIFVKELDEVPQGGHVIFSAHGVAKAVHKRADALQMIAIDATCPLVTKVHLEAGKHVKKGRHILLIGHAGHPEVIGTMGQVAEGEMTLIETAEDALAFTPLAIARLPLLHKPLCQPMKQPRLSLSCSIAFLKFQGHRARISAMPQPIGKMR